MPKAVICMANTQTQAQVIIDRLERAGVAPGEVSLVMPDNSSRYGFCPNSPELLGLLRNPGRIVMSGYGFFVVAGPLCSLMHASAHATAAGLVGALTDFGLEESKASDYQQRVKLGGILILFHTSHNDEALRIQEILENTDGEEILIFGEGDFFEMDFAHWQGKSY